MAIFSEADASTPRRSILRNLTNDNSMQNDDDAERAIRRRTLGKSVHSTSLSNENLIEEQQGLQNCLKIYYDNKINKENAWSLTIIDNMANLCRSHHKALKNFQIVGSSLEASTKIYGLRVDSVHSDIVRMSSGLGRMKTDQPEHDNVENNDFNESNFDGDTTRQQNNDQPKQQIVKKKRIRKAVSTITKNKDTLNARLDICQMPDALYFKLNSIMGETSSSNKLLLSTLETDVSDLKLTANESFWSNEEYEPFDCIAEEFDGPFTELPLKINSNSNVSLRQHLSAYKLTNTPLDDDDESPVSTQPESNSFNMSQIMQEYAFDMAAGIEPIPETENYAIGFDMHDDVGNDFVELTPDDRDAIHACKGLHRKPTIIEDLRPSDSNKLEYSYRPLDNINQFWAGPSYWKFRKSRKLTINRVSLASTSDGQSTVHVVQSAKRRNQKQKAEPTKFTTLIESVCKGDPDSDDDFISIDSRAAQKFKKNNLYKRWDSKKLKLPTDLHIDRNLFDYYTYCPSISIFKENSSETVTNEVANGYDYDNADDDYSMDMANDEHDVFGKDNDDQIMNHITNEPDPYMPQSQQIPDSQNTNIEEISHHYEGAPEMIQKIDIQFARRAKVIDMKQMKIVCLSTIERQFERTSGLPLANIAARKGEHYKDGAASFGVIYNSLPHSLSKTMAENLSPSVAFYSILHLANEHRLRLYKSTKENDMNVFLIRKLD